MKQAIRLLCEIVYAILTALSVYFATANVVSGGEVGMNLGYVESRIDDNTNAISDHETELAELRLKIAELEARYEPLELLSGAKPTPWNEVKEGLDLLKPKSSETLVDFGCGYDARFLIHAARYHDVKKLIGVEIDQGRAESARRHVLRAGLDDQIKVIEGDATETKVDATVGMAYLWPETLEELRPKIQKLDRFASYMHRVPGLEMIKHGNWYLYEKSKPAKSAPVVKSTPMKKEVVRTSKPQPVYYSPTRSQPVYYNSGASWGGRSYSAPVCNSSSCSMCNSIRQQLYYR